jgi:hypothetical protein
LDLYDSPAPPASAPPAQDDASAQVTAVRPPPTVAAAQYQASTAPPRRLQNPTAPPLSRPTSEVPVQPLVYARLPITSTTPLSSASAAAPAPAAVGFRRPFDSRDSKHTAAHSNTTAAPASPLPPPPPPFAPVSYAWGGFALGPASAASAVVPEVHMSAVKKRKVGTTEDVVVSVPGARASRSSSSASSASAGSLMASAGGAAAVVALDAASGEEEDVLSLRFSASDCEWVVRVARAAGLHTLSIEDLRKILYAHTDAEYGRSPPLPPSLPFPSPFSHHSAVIVIVT